MTRIGKSALGSTRTSKSNIGQIDEEIRRMNQQRETQQTDVTEKVPVSECSSKTEPEHNHTQSVAEQEEFIPIKGNLEQHKQR